MVVEIMFTGLIAFVKGHCSVQATDTMQIVMVDGMVAHKPRLIVDVRNVLAAIDPDVLPDEIIELPDGTQAAVWNLDGKRVHLVDARPIQVAEGTRHKIKDKDEYLNAYPREHLSKPDSKNDFSWAPELNRACLLPENMNKPSDLYAKADVLNDATLGDFAVARFATLIVDPSKAPPENVLETELGDATKKEDVFDFDRQIYNYRQVLADHARLKMEFDDTSVTLKVHTVACDKKGLPKAERLKLKCDDPDPTIRLAPTRGVDEVKVSVSNLPSKRGEYPDSGVHFHEYYKLLRYVDHKNCPRPTNPNTKKYAAATSDASATEVPLDPEANIRFWAVQPIKCAICSTCGVP